MARHAEAHSASAAVARAAGGWDRDRRAGGRRGLGDRQPHNRTTCRIRTSSSPIPTTPTPAPPKKVKPKQIDNFQWPVYGYTQSRTRDFDGAADLKPPLHVGWTYNDGALLEFPPVIYHERDVPDRRRRLGQGDQRQDRQGDLAAEARHLAAASPVVAGKQGEVLMPTLSTHGHSPGSGSFFALSMKTGKVIWRRPVGRGLGNLADRRRARRSTTATGPATCMPATSSTATWTGRTTPRARSRAARPWSTASSTSATTRAARMPSGHRTAIRSGRRAPTAPISALAPGSSTRPRRSPTDACTWGTPTGSCIRSAPRTESSRGRRTPADMCTPRRRSPTPRVSDRPYTSAAMTRFLCV